MNFRQFDIITITKLKDSTYRFHVPFSGFDQPFDSIEAGIASIENSIEVVSKFYIGGNQVVQLLTLQRNMGLVREAGNLFEYISAFYTDINQVSVMVNSKGDTRIALFRTYQEELAKPHWDSAAESGDI